ncbi:unnamed protein product [Lymnaea stagnalis]|uniref:Globin n=1 Tax=Lymnaea stagnalis TaxID=6523 RepID=A0AAV2IC44_LYMST
MFSCCKGKRREGGDSNVKPPCQSPTEMFDALGIKASLDDADKKLIIQSGKMFKDINLIDRGVPFLVLFFKMYPGHLRYFKAFKSLTPDELTSLPVTENHGRRVLEQMTNIVDCVNNPFKLKDLVIDLAYRHRMRRVRSRQFKDMLILFIRFIKEELGPKFTQQHENAWSKLVAVILEVLEEEESKVSRASSGTQNNAIAIITSPEDTLSSSTETHDQTP